MTTKNSDPFEYDVALSFAGEDGKVAEELARLLAAKNITVFHDEYEAGVWGMDPVAHLVNMYAKKARYLVMLISQHYPLKKWTEAERTSARERALRDADDYTPGGHKLRFFKGGKAQFVTVGIIYSPHSA